MMNLPRRIILALLWLCMLLPGVSHAEHYSRILALSPHVCEMLYAIGAASRVVGAVSYCDYPADARALPRVGSYKGIRVEAALRLKPDLAIASSEHVKGLMQLKKAGVNIVISNPRRFEDIFHDMLTLGALTGHQQEAATLVRQQRKRLNRIRQHASSQRRVFYELWPDPLLTVGKSGFINTLISEAGGHNVFAHIPLETPRVNIEAVIKARPDMIIIPLEKRNIQQRQRFWNKWLGKQHVHVAGVDPDLLHRPGPRLIDGLEILQRILNQPQP